MRTGSDLARSLQLADDLRHRGVMSHHDGLEGASKAVAYLSTGYDNRHQKRLFIWLLTLFTTAVTAPAACIQRWQSPLALPASHSLHQLDHYGNDYHPHFKPAAARHLQACLCRRQSPRWQATLQ
jgi:hypothetical protein